MNRTELYADQRMNLKEDTDMRFVSLDRRIEALEESAFEDSRKIDVLMDLIESQQKTIDAMLVIERGRALSQGKAFPDDVWKEEKKQEPNLLDDLFGDPIKQLENLFRGEPK